MVPPARCLQAVALLCAAAPVLHGQTDRPTVTVGGVLYAEYAYLLRADQTGRYGNNFDVTRSYLNVIGRFSHQVGGRITPEPFRDAAGQLGIRVKYAYATWNPRQGPLTFKLGMMQTPFVDFDEQLWDYRMQGPIAMDRTGYLSSSDLGAGVEGSWGGERLTLSGGFFNGETYRRAPGDHHKDLAARLSYRLLASDEPSRYSGLRVTGFALVGEPSGGGTRTRFLGQLSWRSSQLTLAGQLALVRDRSDTVAVPITVAGRVASVYGVFRPAGTAVGVIGRVDLHDPDTDLAGDRQLRVIAGVSYRISPNLRVLADLDHLAYRSGAPTPALDAVRSRALFQLELVF